MSIKPDGAKNNGGSREGKMAHPQDKAARTSHEATSNRVFQNVRGTYRSFIIPAWVSATSESEC